MFIFANFVEALAHVAGAAGDLSLVDTVARGELQFFVPGLDLELFEGSRSGRGAGRGGFFRLRRCLG